MIMESWSSWNPKGAENVPAVIHVASVSMWGRAMPLPGHAVHTAHAAHPNEAAVKSRATALTIAFLKRRPSRPLMAAPISGSSGITQRFKFLVIISAGSRDQRSGSHGYGKQK